MTASADEIVEHFQMLRPVEVQPSYNIAPGQKILNIVELEDGSRKAVNLFWGLVPSWAKDKKNSSHLINARMEAAYADDAFALLDNQAYLNMITTPVGDWVNNPRHNDALCVESTSNKK